MSTSDLDEELEVLLPEVLVFDVSHKGAFASFGHPIINIHMRTTGSQETWRAKASLLGTAMACVMAGPCMHPI